MARKSSITRLPAEIKSYIEAMLATGAQAVFYGGDDTTDEDAFAVLGDTDLSIKVGEGSTRARFRVADPDEFAFVLLHLLALRS